MSVCVMGTSPMKGSVIRDIAHERVCDVVHCPTVCVMRDIAHKWCVMWDSEWETLAMRVDYDCPE